MDKYVNTDVGIYHIESICDRRDTDGHKLYHVKCRYCEYEGDMRLYNIKQPTICKHKNRNGKLLEFKPFWKHRRLRNIFKSMQNRCFNPNSRDFYWYGRKGIGIYQEWLDNPKSFEDWALNNGYANNLTIDRIDADKDYCPDNCRWISLPENVRRAGLVSWITIEEITLTGRQWSEKLQLGVNTINTLIRKYGINKVQELIRAMLKEPPSTKQRKSNQSWFSVYDIQV